MHITLVSTGSRGDVQPYVALGVALKRAGHSVRLALPVNFQSVVETRGMEFYAVRGNWQEMLQGNTGQQFMQSGTNLLRTLRSVRELVTPIIEQIAEDTWTAAQETDVLVCHSPLCMFGQSASEKLGIPLFSAEPIPLIPNRAIPSPMFPIQRDLGGLLNAGTSHLLRNIMFRMFSKTVNRQRTILGLPGYNAGTFFRIVDQLPTLEAYSAHVCPRPHEWGDNIHITGYWFLDEPEWTPPQPLLDFLNGGKPPIYVGFGSMSGDTPEKTTTLILDAIKRSGERALISGGWGGITATAAPENILFIDAVPHSWLFPQMSALVHHGGSGTTAAGLRAGIPCVIVPHLADQFYWGKRTYELGVGASAIPRNKLTAENLAAAIRATNNSTMRQRAAELGIKIRAEDGTGAAVRLIEQYSQ